MFKYVLGDRDEAGIAPGPFPSHKTVHNHLHFCLNECPAKKVIFITLFTAICFLSFLTPGSHSCSSEKIKFRSTIKKLLPICFAKTT